MNRIGKRLLSLLLAAILLLSVGGTAYAKITEHPSVRIYVDGLLTGRAYRYGKEIYLSIGDVCAYLGLDAVEVFDRATREISITAEGLSLEAELEREYIEVNGRYLLNSRGILASEGRVFFPVGMIEKIFNLRAEVSYGMDRLDLNLREAEILQGGEHYYEDTYGSENLLWLSRVICAEAGSQPFPGLVGVGNVVLNRVASDQFPNTIYEVIFDTEGGVVQFSPVWDGTIYKDANERSVIAACIALEGYSTVEDALFFLSPSIADDSWLKEYYTFVVSIGYHDFYK